jgi:putative tricarboxylic transport membrane protein
MNRDLVFGSATLAIAIIYYAFTSTIPASQLADPVGPQGLPKVYAIVLALLSVALIVRSLKKPADPAAAAAAPDMRVVGMLLIGIAYILVIPYLGYLLSVALLIAATTYFQGGPLNWRTLLIAISGAALFWTLFIWVLRIQYPAGLWPSLI